MKKCCICGKEFEGWGNNPWPVKSEGLCCDDCNMEHVIPARIIDGMWGGMNKSALEYVDYILEKDSNE